MTTAEEIVAWVRSHGSDASDVRDAAHEASHALETGVEFWGRESIHLAITTMECADQVASEVLARAVEQLVCEAVRVKHDWGYFVAMIEASKSGIIFPSHAVFQRMVAIAKKGPSARGMADRILRLDGGEVAQAAPGRG